MSQARKTPSIVNKFLTPKFLLPETGKKYKQLLRKALLAHGAVEDIAPKLQKEEYFEIESRGAIVVTESDLQSSAIAYAKRRFVYMYGGKFFLAMYTVVGHQIPELLWMTDSPAQFTREELEACLKHLS